MNLKKRLSYFQEIYRPFYWPSVGIITIGIFNQSLAMALPLYYGKIIDGFIKLRPAHDLLVFAFIALALLCLKNILEIIHGKLHVGKIAFDIESHIAEITLGRVMKLSLGQILNHNSGFKQDIIKKGEQAMIEMVELVTVQVVPTVLRIIIAIVGLFVLNAYLGTITLTSITLYALTSYIINKVMMPELQKQNKDENKLGTEYWEIIKHLRLVIINNQERRTIRDYRTKFDAFSDEGKKLWFAYFMKITFIREPFATLGQFGVLVAGIFLVTSGKVSPGRLVMAMSWSMIAFQSVGNIGSLQRAIVRHGVLISRYFQLLEIPPAITVVENPVKIGKFAARIEFRNVSFEYPKFAGKKGELETDIDENEKLSEEETNSAITNMSFVIEEGTTCAFVGHSGAGKSTIINLLLRGYDPREGQILIDGQDLRLINLYDWRRAIGCVEQDPKLWDQTLRFNMTYGLNGHAQEFTNEQLEDLAQRTRISEFYGRLGDKRFETEIGENGVQLSGGQRQRVAIARAIAKSPSLIILDEATNALDPINEKYIHGAIENALVGRTGIIIAHRMSTIRHADRIIVFDKGSIAGNGTHEELMESCKAYQVLVNRDREALAV